jgi:hypothetical protein
MAQSKTLNENRQRCWHCLRQTTVRASVAARKENVIVMRILSANR